jgi:hypothetical protein
MHPGVLTLVTLDDHVPREFSRHASLFVVVPCYWAALVANLIWGHRWMIRHFDRLVGRVHQPCSTFTDDLIDRIWARLRRRFFGATPQSQSVLEQHSVPVAME